MADPKELLPLEPISAAPPIPLVPMQYEGNFWTSAVRSGAASALRGWSVAMDYNPLLSPGFKGVSEQRFRDLVGDREMEYNPIHSEHTIQARIWEYDTQEIANYLTSQIVKDQGVVGGSMTQAAALVGNLVGGIFDPVNVATAGVSGLTIKALATTPALAKAAGVFAKYPVGLGAATGFVEATASIPLDALLAEASGIDYTTQDAAMTMAFGAAAGGVFGANFMDYVAKTVGGKLDAAEIDAAVKLAADNGVSVADSLRAMNAVKEWAAQGELRKAVRANIEAKLAKEAADLAEAQGSSADAQVQNPYNSAVDLSIEVPPYRVGGIEVALGNSFETALIHAADGDAAALGRVFDKLVEVGLIADSGSGRQHVYAYIKQAGKIARDAVHARMGGFVAGSLDGPPLTTFDAAKHQSVGTHALADMFDFDMDVPGRNDNDAIRNVLAQEATRGVQVEGGEGAAVPAKKGRKKLTAEERAAKKTAQAARARENVAAASAVRPELMKQVDSIIADLKDDPRFKAEELAAVKEQLAASVDGLDQGSRRFVGCING